MPQKYAVKEVAPDSYYHVYARGSSKQFIFLENKDYLYFLQLFERYLTTSKKFSKTGVIYPNYRDSIQLLTYCLMRNHFHLLVYQIDAKGLEKLMRSVMTSYSRYFNLKYKRSGSPFESRYKARRIDQNAYLMHISRYIHLNPRHWQTYKHSSLMYYLEKPSPQWLQMERVTQLFDSPAAYADFLQDYTDIRDICEEIKHQLAGS